MAGGSCSVAYIRVMQAPHNLRKLIKNAWPFFGGEVHAKNDPCEV